MLKTCWMGLGCLLLLAGCGSGSSREEAQAKDAAADSKAGPPLTDAGKWVGSETAIVCECAGPPDSRRDDLAKSVDTAGGEAREDAPAFSRLDAFPDSAAADVFRESLGQDGPRADSALPDLIVDARAADLASAAEAGTVKVDSAADRADTSSSLPSFPCSNDSDCCIEIDGCMNVAYLYSTAPGASPKPEIPPSSGWCTNCIPPAIQVRCVAHECVGERLSSSATYGSLLSSHCGPVKLPDADASPYHDLPADAGAAPPKSVWTCGGG